MTKGANTRSLSLCDAEKRDSPASCPLYLYARHADKVASISAVRPAQFPPESSTLSLLHRVATPAESSYTRARCSFVQRPTARQTRAKTEITPRAARFNYTILGCIWLLYDDAKKRLSPPLTSHGITLRLSASKLLSPYTRIARSFSPLQITRFSGHFLVK